MLTDIPRNSMQGSAPPPVRAVAQSPAAGLAVNNAPQDARVAPMRKPEIRVDTEKMAENLRNAIDHINTVLRDGGRGLNFVLDDTLDQPIIKVTRAETGEVIRQIPNETVVRVAHNLEKLQGILFSSVA